MVEIVAAKLGVATGGFYIKNTIGNLQNRNIKGATTKIKNQNRLGTVAIKAVGEGRCRGFIQDAFNVQTSQATCIPGGLALGIIEIGWNGYHRRFNRFPQVGGGIVYKFSQ